MLTQLTGLWPPASTPFSNDGSVNEKQLLRHGKALLSDGAQGLAILGTTSEANSLSLGERRRVIDAFVEGGIPPGKLMPGTGACSIDDAVTLTRHAGEIGAAAVLLLPPFYYKKVSDDGLFAFVASVIERVGSRVPRIMLYHIPAMAGVGWSIDLIARLCDAFPKIIAGMKDSTGDYEHTRSIVKTFPDLAIFPGAEIYLTKIMADGAVGCISATANVNAAGIRDLFDHWNSPDAGKRQEKANAIRKAVESRVTIPAAKAILAARYRDATWLNVRPPLMRLSEQAIADLAADPSIASLVEPVPV
jgi:4-hydroxy-tetrahydrodipicolinate synthase